MTLVVSKEFFKPFLGYYFFNALLVVLQLLHIFWAYLILRMVYKFVFLGKVRRVKREGAHALAAAHKAVYRLFTSDFTGGAR